MKSSLKGQLLSARRFEVIIVILLLLFVAVIMMKSILFGANKQGINTMRHSALKIKDVVSMNADQFQSSDKVYLKEVVDEKLMKDVKSPVSEGNCSLSESYVELVNGKYRITLKCGDYLIQDAQFSGEEEGTLYKVTDWTLENEHSNDQASLFNCIVNGKEKYPNYYEEYYLVYRVNKDFNKNYGSIYDIEQAVCKVDGKVFYRRKDLFR